MESSTTKITTTISRREFFEEWRRHLKKNRNVELLAFVLSKLNTTNNLSEEELKEIKPKISLYSSKIEERWSKSHGKIEVFLNSYSDWLDKQDFEFSVSPEEPTTVQVPGRPEKKFTDCGYRTKKRKVERLLSTDSEQLLFAAEVSLRDSGHRDAANMVKTVTSSSQLASEIKKKMRLTVNNPVYTPDEALALFVDCRLTKSSYSLIRKSAQNMGCTLYPPYYKLQKAKRACCVSEEFVTVTETTVELSLQAILDLTVERLFVVQEIPLISLVNEGYYDFRLFSKWGGDGSSGHSKYKQRFALDEDSDEYLVVFSFVPIKLIPCNSPLICAWQNPVPGSTKFCRPIKFLFKKETTSLIQSETNIIMEQISNLLPTKIQFNGKEIFVSHQLLLTMVDGKICNALSDTKSAQRCYICGATPTTMNTNTQLQADDVVEHYSFGISILHVWIRTFECLLHISYRLGIQKWQIRNDDDKREILERKTEIQKQFKRQLGLNVDMPTPGSGNTNDGNTARKFFKSPEVSSSITGIDLILIKRFGVILSALSSGYEVNIPQFENYVDETRTLYIELYSWFPMPVTVHKLLVHSTSILKHHHIIPIGQLSEEAQEARHKDCRRFREQNTRKNSRESTNRDLMTMLLISSDPIISHHRHRPSRRTYTSFNSEVLGLLKSSSPNEPVPPDSSTTFSELSITSDSESTDD